MIDDLQSRPVQWGFGEFSKVVYYSRYSRHPKGGRQEHWADTVIRVVEGVMSIRQDHYKKVGAVWNARYWTEIAKAMAQAIFDFHFLPPGRGLWVMGTDYIYERGSHALNNCAFVDVTNDLGGAAGWLMDSLMCGVGVGFSTQNSQLPLASGRTPLPALVRKEVSDSREGWVWATQRLIDYLLDGYDLDMDYGLLRAAGAPINGFGGVSSGSVPLIKLHERIREFVLRYHHNEMSQTRLITDVMNAIGACVVAGNVRRSAEIATGSIHDEEFLNLKNYELYPERAELGWMSNNTVMLSEPYDFQQLPVLAERIRDNGEPGIGNLMNIQKYGRYKEKKPDRAIGLNPCGEIPLESHELCNLVEVFPTRCRSEREIYEAMDLATIYASTVALLPSHDASTNAVVERNRRIGVSVSGIADWLDATNIATLTRVLRNGYERVVGPRNHLLAVEANVPSSVRLTTVKPSGTVSQLAGVSPGMHWPIYSHYIRRVRLSMDSPAVPLLIASGVPYEEDRSSDNTWCFEFPEAAGKGKTRSVGDVSVWEQASMVAFLQREWADNAVSNTLNFSPREAGQIEHVLSVFAPQIKSLSFLPTDEHGYDQPPYERITQYEYRERKARLREIDWAAFTGSDGQDTKFCDGDSCELPV